MNSHEHVYFNSIQQLLAGFRIEVFLDGWLDINFLLNGLYFSSEFTPSRYKFNSQVGVTSHLLQKAIYCFILTRRRTAEISVLPTLTAPSTPGNVWLYLQTFEKKSQVKYANVNYCIEGTMTLTCSVTCVSSCLPVRRGTPPAPPATRHLSRVVRNCLLKVILEMLDLFIT